MSTSFQVSSFSDLLNTPFLGTTNAICFPRVLLGDFAEIVRKIPVEGNITVIEPSDLMRLELSEAGEMARKTLMDDWNTLKAQGTSPVLNLIHYYDRDEELPFFPTDVYSFHVDRSPVPTDTILCTYYGTASEILPNEEGVQKIQIPEIRAELRTLYNGKEDGFEDFLTEYFFDLHYQAIADAKILPLGQGNIWKLAVDHPESKVLPCLHRAPLENQGEPRLLLIC